MIRELSSINEIANEVMTDKASIKPSDQRYPIRFIFVNNLDTFKTLAIEMSRRVANFIELSAKIPHPDGWFTSDDILSCFKNITQDTCIIPLSEILRFTARDIFRTMLISIFEIENHHSQLDRRIYLPMLGLWERFESDFYNKFHRKGEGQPIWKISESNSRRIKIHNINFPIGPNHSLIKNSQEWLDLWKNNHENDIYNFSDSMRFLYNQFLPDPIFQADQLTSYKEFIKINLGYEVPFKYAEYDKDYWRQLSDELENCKQHKINCLRSYIYYLFKINPKVEFDRNIFVKLYLDQSETYHHWLLKMYFGEILKHNNTYLAEVLEDLVEYNNDELIGILWTKIFEIEPSNSYFNERKSLLDYIHNTLLYPCFTIEKKLIKYLNNINNSDFKTQEKYLTGMTFLEKLHIINQVSNSLEYRYQIESLKTIYPDLYGYLAWDFHLDDEELDWISTYFKEYCFSKFSNTPSPRLIELLHNVNKDESTFYDWYYKLGQYPDLDDTEVIWIDGLGAEWTSLLIHLINEHGKAFNYSIIKKSIVRVNLPSITSINRHSNATHIQLLDQYIHTESTYSHPKNLIEQIELLKKIIMKEILSSDKKKVSIVSDHGFTFLAQKKYGNFKKFRMETSNHDGRCMWTEKNLKSSTDFLFYVNKSKDAKNGNCLISLKYTSMNNTPYREVHGGATPEEILVPFIVIEKKHDAIYYRVTIISEILSILKPQLLITINPEPNINPSIIVDNRTFLLAKKNDHWCADLLGVYPGVHQIAILIGDTKIYKNLLIKGGIDEEELF